MAIYSSLSLFLNLGLSNAKKILDFKIRCKPHHFFWSFFSQVSSQHSVVLYIRENQNRFLVFHFLLLICATALLLLPYPPPCRIHSLQNQKGETEKDQTAKHEEYLKSKISEIEQMWITFLLKKMTLVHLLWSWKGKRTYLCLKKSKL